MSIPFFVSHDGVPLVIRKAPVETPESDTNETPFEELCKVAAREAFKASTHKLKERS